MKRIFPSKRITRWSVYKRIFLYNRPLYTLYHDLVTSVSTISLGLSFSECENPCCQVSVFRRISFEDSSALSESQRLFASSVMLKISLADRKSEVRQCLGFYIADFLSPLAYESNEKKSKHSPTWDFPPALQISLSGHCRGFSLWQKLPWCSPIVVAPGQFHQPF